MGLLEKAYKYKKEMNRQGKETLIDKIKGPAETDFFEQELSDNADTNPVMDEEVSRDGFADADNTQSAGNRMIDKEERESAETAAVIEDSYPGDAAHDDTVSNTGTETSVVERDDLLPVDMDSFELSEHDINMYKDVSSGAAGNNGSSDAEVRAVDEDYDLFTLPEDNESPLEVLQKQKTSIKESIRSDFSEEPRVPGSGQEHSSTGYMLSDDDPFGMDDEPVISAALQRDNANVVTPSPASDKSTIDNNMKVGSNPAVSDSYPDEDELLHVENRDADLPGATNEVVAQDTAARTVKDGVRGTQEDTLSEDLSAKKDKKFQDFIVLYEIGKEILRSENRKQLYDVILFSIMGQIGASSSSIMITDPDNDKRWKIGDSRGVTIRNKDLTFDVEDSILKKMLSEKYIIDLEDYKNDQANKDEYYKFVSIDGRLVSPLNYNGHIIGAVVMGDKITIGDYSEEEKDFILSVSEISAIALHRINTIEYLQKINDSQQNELNLVTHVDTIKEKLISNTSLSQLKDVIREEFSDLGVISYAAFLRSERFDEYTIILNDNDDILGLRERNFSLGYAHPFIEYVNDLKESAQVDDFKRMKVFTDTFSERQMKLMTYLWIYPFKLGNHLEGFFIVTDINDSTRENEIHSKINRLTMVLFSYILNIRNLDAHELRYVDYIEPVIKRVEKELINAKNLRIPLTIILFSIKNFKRYYSLFGKAEANNVLFSLEEIIRTRLAEPDFSVRYDRNKFLIILPGKNKKYSIPLANTIRNEVLQSYKRKEMQLLVTFLTAEYPEDGDDINTLLDSID